MDLEKFLVPSNSSIRLKDYPADFTGPYRSKEHAKEKLENDVLKLEELQRKLYAQSTHALLIVLQGIDSAGKDGTIRHVMSGVNPMGCQAYAYKAPSEEELKHDYLWRYWRSLPERGKIGIFNRSYFEEVLVVRVHPELLETDGMDEPKHADKFWLNRYAEINEFENYLVDNKVEVLKFFLHLSKDEQKKRFLARLEQPDKNWKFSDSDVKERAFWNDYKKAFEEMLSQTSTLEAPWHIIPADHRWFAHLAVADIIIQKLESLKLAYPDVKGERKAALKRARKLLEKEK